MHGNQYRQRKREQPNREGTRPDGGTPLSLYIHSGVYVYRTLLLHYSAGLGLCIYIAVHMYIDLYHCFTTARTSLCIYTQQCICIQSFTTTLLQRGPHSLYIRNGVYVQRGLLLFYYSAGFALCTHDGVYVRGLPLLHYCSGLTLSLYIVVYMYIEPYYCFTTARVSLPVHTQRCIRTKSFVTALLQHGPRFLYIHRGVCVWRFTTALLQHGIHSLSIHSGVYVHRVLLLPHYSACLALSIYMAVYMYKELYYCFNIVRDSLSVHTQRCLCKQGIATALILLGSHSLSIHSGAYA